MMLEMIMIIGIAVISVMLVATIIDIIKGKRRDAKYICLFKEQYRDKSVVESLEYISKAYKPKSIEALVFEKAIFYLRHSIMMDYKTAFEMIEKVFTNKNVIEFHDEILEKEQKKSVYLLEENSRRDDE